MISHYTCDSCSIEWLAAARDWEAEGERTPAQTTPHEVVLDESTPALLRKQAA